MHDSFVTTAADGRSHCSFECNWNAFVTQPSLRILVKIKLCQWVPSLMYQKNFLFITKVSELFMCVC